MSSGLAGLGWAGPSNTADKRAGHGQKFNGQGWALQFRPYNSTVHTPRQYFILSKHIDRDATCDYKKTTELSILDGPHP